MNVLHWSLCCLLCINFFHSLQRNNINDQVKTHPPLRVQSTTFYVSVDGDDQNSGTSITQSLRTISAAVNKMNESDVCYIRSGVYRESVIIQKNNLTIKNYKNEKVTVTGLDIVKNWKPHKNKIYKAQFIPDEKDENPSSVRHLGTKGGLLTQVFLSDKPLRMASYPNLGRDLLKWEDYGAPVKIFPEGKFKFIGDEISWSQDFWNGAIFHAIVEKKFAPVQGIVLTNTTCGSLTSGWKTSTEKDFKRYLFSEENGEVSGIGRGFITNHINALDTANEWYWDKSDNMLYVWLPEGTATNTSSVEAQSRTLAFSLENVRNVTIEGVAIKAAGVQLRNAQKCIVRNCAITYPVPYYLHRSEFDGYSTVNIIQGADNTIQNCYVAHSWGSGVSIEKGEGNVLENNLIEDVNWMGSYNANVQLGGRGTIVKNNTLRKSGRFLIHGVGVKAGKITHNDMYDCMLIGQDGGAFYTNGASGEGTEIAYNWIHNVKGVPWERAPDKDHNLTIGIYLDGGCKNFYIHHNVIWKTKYAVLLNPFTGNPPKSVEGNKIDFNTCWVSGPASIVGQNSKLYAGNSISHNLANKKVGVIGEKQDNQIDEGQRSEKSFFEEGEYILNKKKISKESKASRALEQQTPNLKVGANHDANFWRPGADTTSLVKE